MRTLTDSELVEVRRQVELAWEFVEKIPVKDHRTPSWYCGEWPAHPELYRPDVWEKANRSLKIIWEEFLYELEKFQPELVEEARQLPIADALVPAADWIC